MCEGSKKNKLSLSLSLHPALTLCVCTCSEVKPDVKIKQTVSCFSNEYCEDSPIGKMPVKITENMFCAGLSLESKHTCKVILFPWALPSLFWDTVWGSTYNSFNTIQFLVYIQEEIKVNVVQEEPRMNEHECECGDT